MRKKLTISAGIVAVFVVGVAVAFIVLSRSGTEIEKDAQAYIDANIPQIVTNWDAQELINRASPALLEVASKEQFTALFTTLSDKLGSLIEYKGSRGQTNMTLTINDGRVVTGTYEADAVFTKAPAVILCRIVRQGAAWTIEEFRVNSDALRQ